MNDIPERLQPTRYGALWWVPYGWRPALDERGRPTFVLDETFPRTDAEVAEFDAAMRRMKETHQWPSTVAAS